MLQFESDLLCCFDNLTEAINSLKDKTEIEKLRAENEILKTEKEIYQVRFTITGSSCTEISNSDGTVEHLPECCNLCLLYAKEMELSKKLKVLSNEQRSR